MKPTILLLLLLVVLRADEFSGIMSVSYGTLYNYENDKKGELDGSSLRINPLLFYKNISLECDLQARNFTKEISPFAWIGGGYRVVNSPKAPAVWLTGSWIYSDQFEGESLPINRTISAPGVGFMFGMKGDWLRQCFTNFSMSYYPSEKALYKSMQLGWEIHKIGFSLGGLGIRVPEGRYFSSFTFSARYAFGKEFR